VRQRITQGEAMSPDVNTSGPVDDQARQGYAKALCDIGLEQILDGKVDLAVETLDESIRQSPSAENYTYRGWAASLKGETSRAIRYCRMAIGLDPEFGNPYNDIGVYLMQLGRLDEAKTWLDRAKQAPRYEPRHFPFLNLGRIHMMLGDQNLALMEFVRALELDPENQVAQVAIAGMDMDFF
jgi:Tfp pilus assembly protein PilF